jgi:hypothetical protein
MEAKEVEHETDYKIVISDYGVNVYYSPMIKQDNVWLFLIKGELKESKFTPNTHHLLNDAVDAIKSYLGAKTSKERTINIELTQS